MPTLASDDDSTLALALRYAAAGLRVLPIKPGTKRPPMREWVEAATTDPAIITNWFTEPLYRDHGVGLAMGRQPDGRFIFALDVDEHDPAHSGSETLADLEGTNAPLPDTWRSLTGSSGMHFLFAVPPWVEVRNGVAGDGLDVRGEGGQIVVAPSIHPDTGRQYAWEHGFAPWEIPIADCPGWLLDIVKVAPAPVAPNPPASPPPGSVSMFQEPDSPAEWLRSWWDWPSELRRAGWVEHHARGDEVHWTRPGKDRRAGESAVLHLPNGPLVVFSTDASMGGLRSVGRVNVDGSVTLSPFEFYAAVEHGGDLSGAARFLLTKMPGATTDSRLAPPAAPVSVESRLDGFTAQAIEWGPFWRDDHIGENWVAEPLIAAGRLTVLYAPAKAGKSEITFATVAAIATGKPILGRVNPHGPQDVVYLDYEMTKSDLWERLELLGYDEHTDLSHLHYYLLPSLPPLDTADGCAVMRAIAKHHNATVVVIDTMGRAVEGDENSNDTYRAFARHTGLGLKADGIAVVRTDHAGKDKEKGQRGASAKNDDADVVFRVDRIEGGWKMTRTHTRVSWIPEVVVVDRIDRPDGTLRVELAQSPVTYLDGTSDYVKLLEAQGISVDQSTTVAQLLAAAKAADPKLARRNRMMGSALKWMKAGLPQFTAGPNNPGARRLSGPTLGDVT